MKPEAKATGIRTFECIVNVSGPLDGTLDDWPAKIQDGIYTAMERKAAEVKLPLAVVHSSCEHDVDDGYYLRIILSEIVMGDSRIVEAGGTLVTANPPINLA